ncbi:MAG: hypothetical protein HYX53_06620 [Chloroflexi bacterium]|nr:hypothetical protein [Chloroflexota bacterium]
MAQDRARGVCMAVIVVTSAEAGAGKTGVAQAIARHYAYLGRPVTLARVAGEGNAAEDAAAFGALAFAPGSGSTPVAVEALTDAGGDALLVVEADAAAATIPGATAVLVARSVAPKSPPAGITPVATVVTDVPRSAAGAPTGTTFLLAEDRLLAGFSVEEARAALNAEVLVVGDANDATCDHLVIAPIASDAGQPYFRRFGTQAVVVRFDKTDMHLAAMKAEPQVLILTGGRRPSDYLFDAAAANGVPVLLSRTDTENTVIALEGVFDRTRFQGERKLDRMVELLEATALFELLSTSC